MTLWFKSVQNVDAQFMRDLASDIGVSWDQTAIVFKRSHVGFKDCPDSASKEEFIKKAKSEYGILLRDSEPQSVI